MMVSSRPAFRKNLSRLLLLLCLLGTIATGVSVYRAGQSSASVGDSSIKSEKSGDYLRLTGLSGTLHHDERAVRKFSIGALTIGPKKLSIFTVGRFYKLTIDRLSLELSGPLEENAWLDLLDGIGLGEQNPEEGQHRKPPYLIVEAVIHDFDLKISENGASVYAITAAKAEFTPREAGVKLLDVVIHDAQTNETIRCKVAGLSKNGLLTIPGEYRVSSSSGMRTRHGWVKQILKAG